MNSLTGILLVALFGCALAQVNVQGPCRSLPVVEFFDASRYEGVWYELRRYDTNFEEGLDCTTADYTVADDGHLDILNMGRNLVTEMYELSEGRGFVSFPYDAPVLGLLNVTFSGGPADEVNYQVVDTDYENYAVVWNCVNLPDGTANEYAWVMARGYEVSGDQQERVDELIAAHLTESQLRTTVQDQQICLGSDVSPAY